MNKLDLKSLQHHSSHFLKMAFSTTRRKQIKKPDGYGRNSGQCGDTVEIFIIVDMDIIKKVTYRTDGCINTNACAATVAFMAEGKTIDHAWDIIPEKVVFYLKTLPISGVHCAELSIGALYKALASLK